MKEKKFTMKLLKLMSLGLFVSMFYTYPVLDSIRGLGSKESNQNEKEKGEAHKKQIILFSETPFLPGIVDPDRELMGLDKNQALVFIKGVRKVASSPERVAYILQQPPETATDAENKIKMILEQVKELQVFSDQISVPLPKNADVDPDEVTLPLWTQISLFAHRGNKHYGSIDFFHGNLDANLGEPLKFFVGLHVLLKQCGIDADRFNDRKKKEVLKEHEDLEETVKMNCSDVTVNDYCLSIMGFLEKKKTLEEPDVLDKKGKAIIDYLNYFKTSEADLLKDILWHIFCKKPFLSGISKFMIETVEPFTIPAGFLNLKWTILNALKDYNTVMVHCDKEPRNRK
jgi:hypothetical protein